MPPKPSVKDNVETRSKAPRPARIDQINACICFFNAASTQHPSNLPSRTMHLIRIQFAMALMALWAETAISWAGAPAAGDYVILLHGLGRTPISMKRLEWYLKKENYRVINVPYPSTRVSIEDAAEHWLDPILKTQTTDPSVKIHFVAHSLGGIVLRQYLSNHKIDNLGRVVMLAPPNQGSELAQRLKNNCLYRMATGPAGQQLGMDDASLPKKLGPVHFDLGVIAGDRSLNPIFSSWIPGPDDGKVSIHSTEIDGMEDFLLVHKTHTWMMWSSQVTAAVSDFLRTGRFAP
jgi:triacylglycerol lipase